MRSGPFVVVLLFESEKKSVCGSDLAPFGSDLALFGSDLALFGSDLGCLDVWRCCWKFVMHSWCSYYVHHF